MTRMTDDIVERLRGRFRYGYPSWHQPCNESMAEAADEIERLRAALREITSMPSLKSTEEEWRRVAKSALEETK